jgi:type III restriction enzyme
VPFTFLPHEGGETEASKNSEKGLTKIEPVAEKIQHEISFPNILRIDAVYKPKLTLDWDKVKVFELDPYTSITEAELAAIIAGKPNDKVKAEIGLEKITSETRLQTIIFKVASTIYNAENRPDWKGSKEIFLAQLVRLVEQFVQSEKIQVKHDVFHVDNAKRKVLMMLNMNKIVQHIWTEIRAENTEKLAPVFDKENPIRSTANMGTWYTSKPCSTPEQTLKSHISHCVVDSNWEYSEAYFLEKSEYVKSYVKNDHLGFVIFYNYNGVIRKYYPDFMIRLSNDEYLILEVKGQDDQKNQTKREFLNAWVDAVNEYGGFGHWHWTVSSNPSDVNEKIQNCL